MRNLHGGSFSFIRDLQNSYTSFFLNNQFILTYVYKFKMNCEYFGNQTLRELLNCQKLSILKKKIRKGKENKKIYKRLAF